MVGTALGHFEILEKLGEGGMGVVFKARDTHLDRLVAVKILPADRVADEDRRRRFVRGHDSQFTTVGEQSSRIDFLSFATGKVTEIVRPPRSLGAGMDVSTDGRSLLFVQTESISEDLMLVENFR